MKRKKPSFNETYYGFRTFCTCSRTRSGGASSCLRRDQRSGSYIVEDLGTAPRRRRRRRRPRRPPSRAGPRRRPRPTRTARTAGAAAAVAAARGGRRTRGGAPLPAGAEHGAGAPDEGDDEDEGEETLAADEGEHHETPRPASAHAPASGAPAGTVPSGERGSSFSLFSWLRREHGPEEDKKD